MNKIIQYNNSLIKKSTVGYYSLVLGTIISLWITFIFAKDPLGFFFYFISPWILGWILFIYSKQSSIYKFIPGFLLMLFFSLLTLYEKDGFGFIGLPLSQIFIMLPVGIFFATVVIPLFKKVLKSLGA